MKTLLARTGKTLAAVNEAENGNGLTKFILTAREEKHELTVRKIGIDVGLNYFYTDSEGNEILSVGGCQSRLQYNSIQ